MAKRITLPQLKKYDVTQKVIEMLADAESRAIIFSIIRKGKTAAELSEKHKIPLSSVYKKISDLEELTLIHVDSWQISEKGRIFLSKGNVIGDQTSQPFQNKKYSDRLPIGRSNK